MSSLADPLMSRISESLQQHPSPEEPSSGTKRKHSDPVSDVRDRLESGVESSRDRSPASGGNRSGNKRLRRVSGSDRATHNGSAEAPLFDSPQETERWKRHLSYKRSKSFSRDPLGLDPNPPPPPSPPSFRSNGHVGRYNSNFRRPRLASLPKHNKDRVIHPPKQIMCPDPLKLEARIKAYKASHEHPDGLSKTERQAERFRHGNYNRYYGYRQVADDPRYRLMRGEWVTGKDCLDVGCNTGQFTLALTKEFRPRMMVGIDIDKRLVLVAKRNVRHYLTEDICQREGFPRSLPILYGPIAAPAILETDSQGPREFPCNIAFLECDYVPKEESHFEHETEEFDTIFALSITKWIHLNCGDEGLKRFFKRAFRHLRPGGLLVLEPQEWCSYSNGRHKGKLTSDMKQIYQSIQIKPDEFQAYLLSGDVGFESCEKITLPSESAVTAGFNRCLFVYRKPASVL